MSDLKMIVGQMSVEVYESLKQAIEIGKWPTGELLSAEQKANSMRLIIAYEHENVDVEARVGYIPSVECASRQNGAVPLGPDVSVVTVRENATSE